MGCFECEMFQMGIWSFKIVVCLECTVFGMLDVRGIDVGDKEVRDV